KNRWSMEVLFKRLKQNFELSYFYSDSPEGIKTQLWIVRIAHLLFTIIHKQIKECEISMLTMRDKLSATQRGINKIQLDVFLMKKGGVFENPEKSP
ncbi:MAG: hypothetical protein ORN54_10940, partial [Cyclobacteriaceae bacterium]|nr:hypothetical protein [Cyclobacteriaceae bacterium]